MRVPFFSPLGQIRFPLRRKVLLPVATMIIVTMAAGLFVVNKVVHDQVLKEVSADLDRKIRAFDSMQRGQLELLAQKTLIVSETPHLRAAIETLHPETVQRELSRLIASISDSVMLVLDAKESILAYHGPDSLQPDRFALKDFTGQHSISGVGLGLLSLHKSYLQAALAPVVVSDSFSGGIHLGYILLGFPVDEAYLAHLEKIIGCKFMLYRGETILQISSQQDQVLATSALQLFHGQTNKKNPSVRTLEMAGGEYLVGRWSFSDSTRFGYMLLAPFGSIFEEIVNPVERTIILLAVLALLAAILISYFISRQVVSPVQKLVVATDAVTTGDYAHPIAIDSQDEIGYLASKFDAMRQSLQKQMATLASQNRELEKTLQQLEKTQQELVQSEKLAATGKITAQLSHELNNPIHNVRSCLESAKRKSENGQSAAEYLHLAHEETVRMGKLVQQMLDFYRPPAMERETVDINGIVDQVLKVLQDRITGSGVQVHKNFTEALPEIQASPDQLKQVFINIIMNALDAMQTGGELKITTAAHETLLEIAFQDTGIGIAAELLPNIFDAFYTTKSRASGVGLGLSVSYGIIRSHGGKILVESEKGKGTIFRVHLPLL